MSTDAGFDAGRDGRKGGIFAAAVGRAGAVAGRGADGFRIRGYLTRLVGRGIHFDLPPVVCVLG